MLFQMSKEPDLLPLFLFSHSPKLFSYQRSKIKILRNRQFFSQLEQILPVLKLRWNQCSGCLKGMLKILSLILILYSYAYHQSTSLG